MLVRGDRIIGRPPRDRPLHRGEELLRGVVVETAFWVCCRCRWSASTAVGGTELPVCRPGVAGHLAVRADLARR